MGYRHSSRSWGAFLLSLAWLSAAGSLIAVWLGLRFPHIPVSPTGARFAPGVWLKGERDRILCPIVGVGFGVLVRCSSLSATVIGISFRMLVESQHFNTQSPRPVGSWGGRLLAFELEGEFENVVDLTAEFSEPSGIRCSPSYRSFPILDGSAPTPEALRHGGCQPSARPDIHSLRAGSWPDGPPLRWLCYSVPGVAHSVEDGLRLLSSAAARYPLEQGAAQIDSSLCT